MQQQASSNNTSVYSSFGKAGGAIISGIRKKNIQKKLNCFFKKL
jgi:hypothetical protein